MQEVVYSLDISWKPWAKAPKDPSMFLFVRCQKQASPDPPVPFSLQMVVKPGAASCPAVPVHANMKHVAEVLVHGCWLLHFLNPPELL